MKSKFIFLIVSILLILSLGSAQAEVLPSGGGSGAIFTTTPDGAIVNENVHYAGRQFVYLDGGPKQNAPAKAAGLDEGFYVFQITDPPGKLLLSRDPARCRIVHVNAAGVIDQLMEPTDNSVADPDGNTVQFYTAATSDNWAEKGSYKDEPCHIAGPLPDSEPGTYAPTPDITGVGRHDTNPDLDHNDVGAIVVQMMPYGLTPNPGGVYKAWMTPIQAYITVKGADLNSVPSRLTAPQKPHPCYDFCAKADPGFVPSHRYTKTDNFKVTEKFPAEIKVRKFEDLNGNGIWDAGEPEIGVDKFVDELTGEFTLQGGWPYEFTEPLNGTTKTDTFYTPGIHVAGVSGIYSAEEWHLPGWTQTASWLDGAYQNPTQKKVDVTVLAVAPGEKHEIWFGNFKNVSVKACKYEDYDGDGGKDKPIAGWTVYLTVKGVKVDTKTTGADGCYTWMNLGPLPADSYYDVGEEVPAGWTATSPTHVDFPHPVSGASYSADFTNFKNVSIKACKVKDIDGLLSTVDDRYPVEGWTVELTKNDVVIDTQKTGVDGCYTWTNLGPVPGGWYDVHEAVVDGWIALSEKYVKFMPILSGGSYEFTFVNAPMKGCTPGFWQGGNDFQTAGGKWYWNTYPDPQWAGFYTQPYYWETKFCTFFGCSIYTDKDMWYFINPDGWTVNDDFHKAARSLVAAYLNASWGMAYAFTTAELDAMWDAAYSGGTLYTLHTILDKANNAMEGCPISASIP